MADVSAKDGSQETLVNLAALITNLTLLPFFTATLSTTWATFLICVALHLLANYRAMRALTLASLNRPRLLHLLSSWVGGGAFPAAVPSPATTNLAEPLLFGPAFIADYFPHGFRVSIGCSLHWALQRCGGDPGELFRAASKTFKGEKYMLCGSLRRRQLHIVYHSDINTEEELQAVVTAFLCVLNYCHATQGTPLPERLIAPVTTTTATTTTTTTTITTASEYELITGVRKVVVREFPALLKSMEELGWKVDKLHFGADEWRLMDD